MLFSASGILYAQLDPLLDDPYLDPETVAALLPDEADTPIVDSAFMIGTGWGIHPIHLFGPPIMLGYHRHPWTLGFEYSDTDKLNVFAQQRTENFGPSRATGTAFYVRRQLWRGIYGSVGYENRQGWLWNRTYNRTGFIDQWVRKARYDLSFETKVVTLGTGFQHFSDATFLAVDIIRYNVFLQQTDKATIHINTWTVNKLNEDMQDHKDNWNAILAYNATLVVTWGLHF
ncbi:MAG TPA: hypothetical protein EYQ29_09075 [Candidatus Lambdaproteobacteria bacterium]|nr:hypothetical protein [Candidatus Lambdaproteobacteria bacterium]